MKPLKLALIAALPLSLAGMAAADEIMAGPQPGGNSVTVDEVTISKDGWLVVHAIKDGKPVVPASIGRVPLKAGTTKNVTVPLDVMVKPGDKVLTMLHVDAGKAGVFEFPGADAPVKQGGKPVVKPVPIK